MKIILSLLMLISPFIARAQNSSRVKYEPYFSAVIVHDVDSSAGWYQSVFGLQIKNRINDKERGFRVMILESPTFLLELIENRSWPAQKKLLADKPEGTRIEGFFKIGFKVPDMNSCLKHLADLKIIPIKRLETLIS